MQSFPTDFSVEVDAEITDALLTDNADGVTRGVGQAANDTAAAQAAILTQPFVTSAGQLAAALQSITLDATQELGEAETGDNEEHGWQTASPMVAKDHAGHSATEGGAPLGSGRGGRLEGSRIGRNGRKGRTGGYSNNSHPSSTGGASSSSADD